MSVKPFFILSSGRSGSAMMAKALSGADNLTIEHEYMVHTVQPLAVRRYHGLAETGEVRAILSATHGAAIAHARTAHWGDSSNKLSWLIPELAAQFPEARFVHLARDGRKVAGSYFHKLGAECYDDRSVEMLREYLADPRRVPEPPPEKKYWWPQARSGDPWAEEFSSFHQFERIAWHWAEVNRIILRDLALLPPSSHIFVRLEDLRAQPAAVAALFAFLGLEYRPEHHAVFSRPHNVNRPVDRRLTPHQSRQFARIAGAMMQRLGYGERAEYLVNY
jgi:Sulfotransferase family